MSGLGSSGILRTSIAAISADVPKVVPFTVTATTGFYIHDYSWRFRRGEVAGAIFQLFYGPDVALDDRAARPRVSTPGFIFETADVEGSKGGMLAGGGVECNYSSATGGVWAGDATHRLQLILWPCSGAVTVDFFLVYATT
jgi:hypothetical protein